MSTHLSCPIVTCLFICLKYVFHLCQKTILVEILEIQSLSSNPINSLTFYLSNNRMPKWTLLHYDQVVDRVPLFWWTQICHLDERYEHILRSTISLPCRITSKYPSRCSVHPSLVCSVLGRLNYTDYISRPLSSVFQLCAL